MLGVEFTFEDLHRSQTHPIANMTDSEYDSLSPTLETIVSVSLISFLDILIHVLIGI